MKIGTILLVFAALAGCWLPFAGEMVSVSGVVSPRQLPPDALSLVLEVSGPGMKTVEKTFADPTDVTLEVPSGRDRRFDIRVNTPSVILRGITIVDLAYGEAQTVQVTMNLYRTRLIAPDARNSRLVRIDDMSGAGWSTLVGATLGFGTFVPYDVDYDNRGRLYIAANTGAAAAAPRIYRVDDWSAAGGTPVVMSTVANDVRSLAVDRENERIYYVDRAADELHRCDLNGNNDVVLDTSGVTAFLRSVAVHPAGVLIVGSDVGPGGAYFTAYDPATETALDEAAYSSSGYEQAWDVQVKGLKVFAAVYDTTLPSNSRVLSLLYNPVAKTLSLAGSYGNAGIVAGPTRFLAPVNDPIVFIDEGAGVDRLVSIDDFAGANRQNYGATGTGTGQFQFFN